MMGKSKVKSQKSPPQADPTPAEKVKSQKVFYFYILLLPFSYLFFTFNCFAQQISSTELINNAKQYDGTTVIYSGEVIGDVMRRGQYAWINVNDGKSAIGVWVPTEMAQSVIFTGNYKTKGDLVEISGIFQRSCPEHGGDLDIHAQVLRKISSGYQTTAEKVNFYKSRLTITLALIAGLVWILSLLNKQ